MAYLIEIVGKCERCRDKRATHELYDYRNELRGKFCRLCSKRALKERTEWEQGRDPRNNTRLLAADEEPR